KLGRAQPHGLQDAFVQGPVRMVPDRLAGESHAQEVAAIPRRGPLVGADEGGQGDIPAGFLQDFAPGRRRQRFVGLQVAGRLVEHLPAVHRFLDHQQPAVPHHDGGDGHVRLPEAALAIAQSSSPPTTSSSNSSAIDAAASIASSSTSAWASASILITYTAVLPCLTQPPSLRRWLSSSRRLATEAGKLSIGDW